MLNFLLVRYNILLVVFFFSSQHTFINQITILFSIGMILLTKDYFVCQFFHDWMYLYCTSFYKSLIGIDHILPIFEIYRMIQFKIYLSLGPSDFSRCWHNWQEEGGCRGHSGGPAPTDHAGPGDARRTVQPRVYQWRYPRPCQGHYATGDN